VPAETAKACERFFTFEGEDYRDVCRILAERERDSGNPTKATNGGLLAGILREWEAWKRERAGVQPKTHRCPECGRPMEAVGPVPGKEGERVRFRCRHCSAEVWDTPR
jgi:hypothetical protein